ncbi:unnamed protein product [Polarella glacialis]|uniref:Uncharacterized protein n=1 Tax=Polarella glacialis TaxID=89957 RepID=A0A813DNL6_POLGL|nr:unnamed protein product [Polarella glacialis]
MASPLDEVVSRKEAEHATLDLTSAFDGQGRLRLTKAKHKRKLPTTTEELRTKYRIEGNLWLMLAAKFRNKPWLVGTDANTFQTFASYILGEKVALIEIPKADGAGMQQLGPPWQLVLHYEYTLRREALKRVQEGDGSLTLDTALASSDKGFGTEGTLLHWPPGPVENGQQQERSSWSPGAGHKEEEQGQRGQRKKQGQRIQRQGWRQGQGQAAGQHTRRSQDLLCLWHSQRLRWHLWNGSHLP